MADRGTTVTAVEVTVAASRRNSLRQEDSDAACRNTSSVTSVASVLVCANTLYTGGMAAMDGPEIPCDLDVDVDR
jgi:hypothetical protein